MQGIKGFECLYAVDRNGNIWAEPRMERKWKWSHSGRWLKFGKRSGYSWVWLIRGQRRVGMPVHRIVAEAFLEKIPGKSHINHKNGIKTDNRVENLEWCTPAENLAHAWETGLIKKIVVIREPPKSVAEIRSRFRRRGDGKRSNVYELAKEFGIGKSQLYRIVRGQSWGKINV